MICADSDLDCDNPGCRRGGCQGRRPKLPLSRDRAMSAAKGLPLLEAAIAGGTATVAAADRAEAGARHRGLIAG